MADNALTRLSLLAQMAVAVVVALLIAVGFWYFKLNPMFEEEGQKRTTLDALQRDIRALEVTANKLPEFQREVDRLEKTLETLKRILPPEKEIPDLMRKIQYLAAQSNLAVKKFDPSTPVGRDFYQEIPINIALEGTYHNLGLFFDRLGRLPRLINAGNVSIKARPTQSASNTIAVSCVATTFVYVEPPPAPAGAPGQVK